MSAAPVGLFPLAASFVPIGGQAVEAAFGPVLGGAVVNPTRHEDQNITVVEVLYVDVTGAAATPYETATTFAVQPGSSFLIGNQVPGVSVNAKTSGHKFSGYILQPPPPFPPTPQPGPFPPLGPTVLSNIIPSYLYKEYADDDDLQAFVSAYNALAQGYASWFADVPLGVYTNSAISGALLDWVAEGLYGMQRPALSSGKNRNVGPFNTWPYNTIPYDRFKRLGPANVQIANDDVFKRCLTWNFYRGDGMVFSVPWLKRRVMRFLLGANGSAPNIDATTPVSVTYGPGVVSIRLNVGTRQVTGGAVYNRFAWNTTAYNALRTVFMPGPNPLPFENVLQEAVASGVLQLPFQLTVTVTT
jgi:hypothetical protein